MSQNTNRYNWDKMRRVDNGEPSNIQEYENSRSALRASLFRQFESSQEQSERIADEWAIETRELRDAESPPTVVLGGGSCEEDRASPSPTSDASTVAYDVGPDGPGPVVVARPFRLQGKRLFFTWPRFSMSAKAALRLILAWRKCERAMVARESHEDGGFHLHALIWLDSRLDVRTCTTLDNILGAHGNYQVMKDPVKAVQYLMKEGVYETFGFDPVKYVAESVRKHKASPKWQTAVDHIQKRKPLVSLEDQAFVGSNLRKLLFFENWWRTQNPTNRVGTWEVRTVLLHGETGVGKSYWARRQHGLGGEVFALPYQRAGGTWWDTYAGERILLLDDFDPICMPLRQLLRVLDPYELIGMIKGATIKLDFLEVIITNQHHPKDWYPLATPDLIRALLRRIKCVYVDSRRFQRISFTRLFNHRTWPEEAPGLAVSTNYVSQ